MGLCGPDRFNAFQEDACRFVVGVLRHQFAAHRQFQNQPAQAFDAVRGGGEEVEVVGQRVYVGVGQAGGRGQREKRGEERVTAIEKVLSTDNTLMC